MNRSTIDLWVGIFVLLGLGAILFLSLKVGNLITTGSRGEGYHIEAAFDNIGGLKVPRCRSTSRSSTSSRRTRSRRS
jgi:phospholipid/cholesterol/gamma-HCH transport system substrate-binding protein